MIVGTILSPECIVQLLTLPSDPDDSVFAAVTDVQIEEFRDVFRIFDADQDGNISSTELIKILK